MSGWPRKSLITAISRESVSRCRPPNGDVFPHPPHSPLPLSSINPTPSNSHENSRKAMSTPRKLHNPWYRNLQSHSKFTKTVTSPLCASGGWHLTLSHSQTNPAVSCAQRWWYTDLNNSRQQEQTTKAFASPFPANTTRVSEPGPAHQQFPSLLRLTCHLWSLLTALAGGRGLQRS